MEWLCKSMLGIKIKGENRFEISPVIGLGVNSAKGSYQSLCGEVSVSWKKEKEGVSFELSVPINTKATFVYSEVNKELEPGEYHFSIN